MVVGLCWNDVDLTWTTRVHISAVHLVEGAFTIGLADIINGDLLELVFLWYDVMHIYNVI